jgi:H+/Cl- antiporter ClcA
MSDDHLNSNRIRKMAALRRGAIRSRSYCLIALGGCVAGAAELIFDAVRRWPAPVDLRGVAISSAYSLCAALLLALGGYFLRLGRRFHREARQSAIPPPAQPPDFSTLQDGSQIAKNLEDVE